MRSYHDDVKRVKTKAKTKSVKYYEQLRQEELERQCENFYMSLDYEDVEEEPYEKGVDCDVPTPPLEEGHMEVHTTYCESKTMCVEAQDKGLVRDESELKVGVEKSKSLKVSCLSETTRRDVAVGMLLCSCETCLREFQSCELDELLGFEVGPGVTMMSKEEQLGLVIGKGVNGFYISSCLKASNLLGYENLCPIFGRPVFGGKIYNLLTPHYHYNMLVRLMEMLVDMNAAVSLFEGENNLFHVHSSHLAVVKLCWVLVVESFFGLNCLSLTMIKLNLLYLNDGVILFSTWESVRGIKMEEHKHFHVQTHEAKVGMKCHGGCLEGILEGHYQYHFDGMWGIPFQCCLKRLLAGCGKSEHMRDLLKPNTTGFRRLNQWVKSVWDYDLPWFKWLIMMTVKYGDVSYLWWRYGAGTIDCFLLQPVERECALSSIQEIQKGLRMMLIKTVLGYDSEVTKWLVMKGIGKGSLLQKLGNNESTDMPWIGEKGECVVPIMPENFHINNENDSSWGRETNNMIMKASVRNCHGSIFKVSNVDGPSLKGTGHGLTYMINLGVGNIDGNESKHLPSKAAESIGKWFNIANLEVKATDVVAGNMNLEKNPRDYFFEKSEGDRMKQNADAQVSKKATKVGRFRLSSLNLNSATGEPKMIPIFKFKSAWIGIVYTKGVTTRASSDETTKDEIEWMIAWEEQPNA